MQFNLIGVSPAAEVFGSPLTKDSRAALESAAEAGTGDRPPIERVEPPEVIVDALNRTRRTTEEVAHPSVVRTGERLARLTKLLDGKLLRHAFTSQDVRLVEAIEALSSALQDLNKDIVTGPAHPAPLARIVALGAEHQRRATGPAPDDLGRQQLLRVG